MKKSKILIVDDDARISGLLHALLEKAGGYEVKEENRSFAALATARHFRPDLVVMDVDMPGKSGGDVARELNADPILANTPVLFVTSLLPRDECGIDLVMRGNQQFLSKPVDPRSLLRVVQGLLGQPAVQTAA